MKQYLTALALAGAVTLGQVGTAVAQGTTTTIPNGPSDGSINNPTSPASSNRGDPGTEPANPNTGGGAIGQGEDTTVSQGQRPLNTNTDPATDPHNPQASPAHPLAKQAPAPGTIGQRPADTQVVPPNAQPDDAAKPLPPNSR